MWALGNEVNLAQPEGFDPAWSSHAWYTFLNQLAQDVKAVDGNHPTMTAEGEIPNVWGYNVGVTAVGGDDASLSAIDIWGINAYRGKSFQGLIQSLAVSTMTLKPIYMTEFGKDAYRDSVAAEDQDMQASYVSAQYQEINANLSAAGAGSQNLIGASVFEWTDEWWKVNQNSCFTHDTPVLFSRAGDTIDPNYQDEWFGITSVSSVDAISNPAGTARQLRKSYTALQQLWSPGAAGAGSGATTLFEGTVRNFPNPFRVGAETTKFVALVTQGASMTFGIYDAGGQFVTSITRATNGPGRMEVVWDGRNSQGAYVSAGLYIVRIEGKGASLEQKQFRRVVAVK